jgi:hypothetical protein
VFGTMAAHDPLFDPDCAIVIYSKTANAMPLPVYDVQAGSSWNLKF